MKKSTKKLVLGVGLVSLLILGIAYYGVSQTIFGLQNPPHHIYSGIVCRASCDPASIYDKFLGDYGTKVNVKWVNTYDEEKIIENDNNFIWDISSRTCTEFYGSREKTGGIPPQIRCDGSLDCDFGYSQEEWKLRSDNLCYARYPIDISIPDGEDPIDISIPDGEDPIVDPECTSNADCEGECQSDQTAKCENEVCVCEDDTIFIDIEENPYYLYLIPVTIFGLIALIVWMKLKKPKRRKWIKN